MTTRSSTRIKRGGGAAVCWSGFRGRDKDGMPRYSPALSEKEMQALHEYTFDTYGDAIFRIIGRRSS